jgi:hypothetical protein
MTYGPEDPFPGEPPGRVYEPPADGFNPYPYAYPYADDPHEPPGPADPGTWNDPADTETRWGYGGLAEPTCRHGVTGPCYQCETECIHGQYGPSCRDCQEAYGP